MQWSQHCKVPAIQIDNRGNLQNCYENHTPNQAAMVNLVNTIKKFCKNEGKKAAKSDKCSTYWIENDCYNKFDGLQHKTYNLGNNKRYNANFEIPDAPCERKLVLPAVPKGKTCLQFAKEHISQHNQNCFRRFQNRVSTVNCLANDEWSDCNMDMGQFFMKWSKKCQVSIQSFNNWSLGF